MLTYNMIPYLLLFPLIVIGHGFEKDENGCPPYPTVEDGFAYPPGPTKNGEHVFITCHYNSSDRYRVRCMEGNYTGRFPGCPKKPNLYRPDPYEEGGCLAYNRYYPHSYALPNRPYKNGEDFVVFCDEELTLRYPFTCENGSYVGYFDHCPDKPIDLYDLLDDNNTNKCVEFDGHYDNAHAKPPGPFQDGEEFVVTCDHDPSIQYLLRCYNGVYKGEYDGCPEGPKEPGKPVKPVKPELPEKPLDDEDTSGCGVYQIENGHAYPPGPVKNGEPLKVTCSFSDEQYDVNCKDGVYIPRNLKCPGPVTPANESKSGCGPYGDVENGFAWPTGHNDEGEELAIICPREQKVYTLICKNGTYHGTFTKCRGN
ncbi:hypothetical protein DICVIV_00923 [Dictyocaulus viviparus]|uniref:Chitin binding Peritrophin-A domain protein n=1 Tax=Dictyocaulus viviparus TaxID=29172 RepID=A0A0D8Y9K5_DICVI|nr:hypothetical protein DICVIV_00923 [Dictyocaulus viviparus]